LKSSRDNNGLKRKKFRGPEVRRFLRACEQGRLAEVKRLLLEGHDPNGHDDVRGERPLHVVARAGHVPVARSLLSAGANIEAQIGYGGLERPLDCAAEKGQIPMIRFLLSRGAKVNVGGTSLALHCAILEGQRSAVALLLRKRAKLAKDSLYWAARTGDVRLAKLLIKAGAKINGDGSHRPIRAAARLHESSAMLKMLIEHGADLDARREEDRTTLLHIVSNEDSALLLIKSGLDVRATDRCGETPLHHCASRGFVRACRLLIERGADPLAKTQTGFAPRDLSQIQGPVYGLLTEAPRRTSAARQRTGPAAR
jgi:ankyrin repeat protein